jgi:predicted DNA-binding ribbon-helix-helix protein
MKSSVVKHSIQLQRHKTSVSLEDPFWNDLKKIAIDQRVTLSELVTTIDESRGQGNLSSAIRLFVLNHVRNQKRMDGRGGGSEGTPEFSSEKRHGRR